ncbi:MAG: U32 family peptidase [Lachnospiraceae bacterium]|nr:U32 family peptidase [Lachnospiraceae bacterium]
MGEYVELLAPAGSYEAFLGAVNAGADAVYLGGQRFGARAYADNFTAEEIIRALRVAHFYGKKIYLTVNTLLKEREMAALHEYLLPFYGAGLDGVIVQDFGVFCFIREHFPGLPLHVSTQMTVTGAQGASLLKEQGAVRIVPARELSLEEVRKIREEAGVEVECFIHGAMCYCYSGQCLFSSILGGRSGNRGRCAQPCRLPYEIYDGKKRLSGSGYPLSLKDMCTLAYLPALLEAGIDSFKIEGRMKRPEYAAGVTAIYRKYIDLYYREGPAGYRVAAEDMDRLRRLYIRSEIQTGYYERHNGKEMITLEKPGYEGCDEALLSEIRERYIREPDKIPVRIRAQVKAGEAMRLRMESVSEAESGSSEKQCRHEATGTMRSAAEEKPPETTRPSVEMTGETVQPAKNAPLSEEEVRKRLCKTGDSFLLVEDCEIVMEGACFVPVRALNELRRSAVEAFEAAVAESRGKTDRQTASLRPEKSCDSENKIDRLGQSMENGTCTEAGAEKTAKGRPMTANPAVDVTVSSCGQLRAVLEWGGCRRIYIESGLFMKSYAEITGMAEEAARKPGGEERPVFYLALPYILRERDEAYLRRLAEALGQTGPLIRGFLVRGLEGLAWARKVCRERENGQAACGIVPDAGLYCFNADALRFFRDFSAEITLPYELNAGEAAHLVRAAGERGMAASLIAYSRIPMMVAANCVQKTAGLCGTGEGQNRQLMLKDRLGRTFQVEINCDHCYNIIYNCVPYSLHGAGKARERIGADALRYDFTTEDGTQCRQILEGAFPFTDYTTGHCKRGVE